VSNVDPFQCGRESAEAARRSLSAGPADLVLALAPNDDTFKDFIEGVRVASGENALVGLPVPWVRTTEADCERLVVKIQGQAQRLSVVSAAEKENALRGATSIVTDLRRRRGNARLDFSYHGLIAFDAGLSVDRRAFAHVMASETGLESWVAGFDLFAQSSAPVICGARSVQSGIGAVECLTEEPWGLGWVDTSAFPDDETVHREASRSAVREAIGQLGSRRAAAAILFFSSANRCPLPSIAREAFEAAHTIVPGIPLVGFPVRSPYLRVRSGIVTVVSDAVVALVIPE
jgi:hypothetical protein